jgi:hypothetical protein
MFLSLLFTIPAPWKWSTDQVANIISLIAATATVGALWYAYHRDRQQDKKINDLSNIVTELAESNTIFREQTILERQKMKIHSKPNFQLVKVDKLNNNKRVEILFHNEGEIAKNVSFESSGEVEFKYSIPEEIPANGYFQFVGITEVVGGVDNTLYVINLYYEDYFNNKYHTTIIGDKGKNTLLWTRDL